MTKEELKQEAEAEADKVIIGSGMDRTSVIHLKHLLVTMYIQGATKVTKELQEQIEKLTYLPNGVKKDEYIEQIERANKNLWEEVRSKNEQIEKMKCCKNCANYMISGKCPCFFKTGWCKNWEMTKE